MALLLSWLYFVGPICFVVLSVIVAIVGLNNGKCFNAMGLNMITECGTRTREKHLITLARLRAPPSGLFSSYVYFVTPASLRHSDAGPSVSPARLPWRLFTGRNGSYLEGYQLEDEG